MSVLMSLDSQHCLRSDRSSQKAGCSGLPKTVMHNSSIAFACALYQHFSPSVIPTRGFEAELRHTESDWPRVLTRSIQASLALGVVGCKRVIRQKRQHPEGAYRDFPWSKNSTSHFPAISLLCVNRRTIQKEVTPRALLVGPHRLPLPRSGHCKRFDVRRMMGIITLLSYLLTVRS